MTSRGLCQPHAPWPEYLLASESGRSADRRGQIVARLLPCNVQTVNGSIARELRKQHDLRERDYGLMQTQSERGNENTDENTEQPAHASSHLDVIRCLKGVGGGG